MLLLLATLIWPRGNKPLFSQEISQFLGQGKKPRQRSHGTEWGMWTMLVLKAKEAKVKEVMDSRLNHLPSSSRVHGKASK